VISQLHAPASLSPRGQSQCPLDKGSQYRNCREKKILRNRQSNWDPSVVQCPPRGQSLYRLCLIACGYKVRTVHPLFGIATQFSPISPSISLISSGETLLFYIAPQAYSDVTSGSVDSGRKVVHILLGTLFQEATIWKTTCCLRNIVKCY
jgi:hypothetical protein